MTQRGEPIMKNLRSARQKNRGVTLIELMVGLAIGLLLVIIASTIYLYSKKSYNAVTENSQMEENGRFALDLLSKYIQSAGFATIDPTAATPTLPLEDKLGGCEYGFTNASSASSPTDLTCLSAAPTGELQSAGLFTRYETDLYASTAGKQQGFGCTNEAAASKLVAGVQTYESRSYFFVSHVTAQTPYGTRSMGQLSCVSDATPSVDGVAGAASYKVQPLIPGIEQLAIRYIAKTGRIGGVPLTTADWEDVAAVEVCVLARSIQASGNDTGTQYTDCYGNTLTAGPSESYRAMRSTVALRNTATL